MKQKISIKRQITLNRLHLRKIEILKRLPKNLFSKKKSNPLISKLYELYIDYSNELLEILRYLAPEAGYTETPEERIHQVTNYGPLIDVMAGKKLKELLDQKDSSIIIDIFEKQDDLYVVYIFDPQKVESSPTLAIHEAKDFEEIFQAELENIKFSTKDKIVFGASILISTFIFFLLDDIVQFTIELFLNYQSNVENNLTTSSIVAASIVGILVLFRFGGRLLPKIIKNLGVTLFGVKKKERLYLKTKRIMSNRTDSRRVFVDLYTQARMPVDDKNGINEILNDHLDNLDVILFGEKSELGLLETIDAYWRQENEKWHRYPRKILFWIPFLRWIIPSNIFDYSPILTKFRL